MRCTNSLLPTPPTGLADGFGREARPTTSCRLADSPQTCHGFPARAYTTRRFRLGVTQTVTCQPRQTLTLLGRAQPAKPSQLRISCDPPPPSAPFHRIPRSLVRRWGSRDGKERERDRGRA